MPTISYIPGNGKEYQVEVEYIAFDYPCAKDSTCAFCKADPCNERSDLSSNIAKYYKDSPKSLTCPMCDGRPT